MKKSYSHKGAILLAALTAGWVITWVDSRPTWDDTGITAVAIFATTMMFGGLRPQQVWLSALAVGIWIPLLGLIRFGNYATVLALVFAFAGAYAGALVRYLLGKSRSAVSSSEQSPGDSG
jgi:hypothetical protein